nr:hypothetical protein [Tanacetum cinerariifolium]
MPTLYYLERQPEGLSMNSDLKNLRAKDSIQPQQLCSLDHYHVVRQGRILFQESLKKPETLMPELTDLEIFVFKLHQLVIFILRGGMLQHESYVRPEGECDGPPEPEWEGTISSFGGAIILPSITPVVKKARKVLARKNSIDEEKPTLINILARPCAPMTLAICATGSSFPLTRKVANSLVLRAAYANSSSPASSRAAPEERADVPSVSDSSSKTLISKESSFQEGECDGPPKPEWEGTISSFGGAIILPSITPVVKKARKALAKKNARDEEKPTLINILARPWVVCCR